jgi:hypothetical protein
MRGPRKLSCCAARDGNTLRETAAISVKAASFVGLLSQLGALRADQVKQGYAKYHG